MNNDDFFRVIDPENSRQIIPTSSYRTKPAQPKKKQKPEAALQKKIVAWLEANGAIVLRTNAGVFVGKSGERVQGGFAGVSDLTACYRGKFIAIEVKIEGRPLTKMQQRYLDRVAAQGGIAMVARSVDDVRIRLAEVKE